MFDREFVAASPDVAVAALKPLSGKRLAPARRRVSFALKRGFDIAVGGLALLALAPLLALIAAAVALTSPGPVLFRQRRTGLNGQVFHILKFRSMTVVEDGDEIRHAVQGDLRVTRVGAVLRRTSLDELPQLLNVVLGDMSIVGPRPHALAHDAHYGGLVPRYSERFAVRPGLTGFAQIQGFRGEIRSLDCMRRRVSADADYAAHWSFRRDLSIILRTLPLLLRQTNAY